MTATPITPLPSEIADERIVNAINNLVEAVNTLNDVSTPPAPED